MPDGGLARAWVSTTMACVVRMMVILDPLLFFPVVSRPFVAPAGRKYRRRALGYAASLREARLRSVSFRNRLRIRIDSGVTSTSSSSAMNSTAYSRVS